MITRPIAFATAALLTAATAITLTLNAQNQNNSVATVLPLRIDRFPQFYSGGTPLTSEPDVFLRFSGPVSLDDARSHLFFTDRESGRRIPVLAERPDDEKVRGLQPYSNPQDQVKDLPADHFVSLKPITPLPVGAHWQLLVLTGLATADGKMALTADRTDQLGFLAPFTVQSIRGVNPYDSPREIEISLSKQLHDSLTGETLGSYIDLQPKPENLNFEINYSRIRISGDFRYDQKYEVTVQPGLVGFDRTLLEKSNREAIVFLPNPGFITLPAFSETQNASGTRKFKIMTGNLDAVKVRVKELNDRDLVYALRGYQDVYEGGGDEKQVIPFEMVPGKNIYELVAKRKAQIDESEKIAIDWGEVLGSGRTQGALYLCAEGKSSTRKAFSVGAQAIVQLTDIGMAWKQADDKTLLFVFSLADGQPLAEATVAMLDENAEPVSDTRTSVEGLATITHENIGNVRWLAVRKDGDRHVMRFSDDLPSTGLWSFSIPYRYGGEPSDERRTLVFTDRDVYKPGERVFLKCITRMAGADALLPVSRVSGPVSLKVFDSRHRLFVERNLKVSDQGSFDASFELPEGKLGWYSVEVDFNDPEKPSERRWEHQSHHGFQVAEYRPNTFEIDLDAASDYPQGEEIQVPLSAKYYMGKPLSKAMLSWHVSAWPDYPRLRGFEEFQFGDVTREHSPFTAGEEAHLGKSGEATITFALPEQKGDPAPMRVSLDAEVTDINQQTLAQSASFVVHSSDFYLGMMTPQGIHRAGAAVPLSFTAVGSDSKLYGSPVDAVIKVEKRQWNTVKVRGAGGRITNRTEETLIPVLEKSLVIEPKVQKETGLPLSTVEPLVLPDGGDYFVSVSATDGNGNPVHTRTQMRVIGAEEPAWGWYDEIRIDVTADKESYRVGDTAKLLVRSPVLGHAIVSVERGGVQKAFPRIITDHETVIEVPIEEGAAPNLFASVLIVRGLQDSPHQHPNADFRLGYCQLKVDDPASELRVKLDQGDKPYHLPGGAVEVVALVSDHRGKPVPDTEVTLFAADEGVLSLTGYQTPKPAGIFGAPFPLSVRTGQSLSALLPESPLEQNFGNKGYVIGGGGEGVGLDPAQVRKNFKALAFWEGALRTGPDGKVQATFTAPDNLTTYRLMAVVASGNRFGSEEADLVVNKPLIIEPALPAFGNAGDHMDLSGILHNNTREDLELEIRVNLDQHAEFLEALDEKVPTRLEVSGSGADFDSKIQRLRRMTVRAGETEKVTFPSLFTRMGEATWTWQAKALNRPDLADAVESKLEIGYPIPLLRGLEQVTLKESGKEVNALAKIDPTLLTGRGTVRVSLSNSRVLEAMDALNYLLRYPYGCVEQTTSATLPWLSTKVMRDSLPQLNRSDDEIRSVIEKGTKRLLSMQTRDGGLGYWPGSDDSMLWGSAYGGMALALAVREGIPLPPAPLAALWDYLEKQLRDTSKVEDGYGLYQRSLAIYTLALAGRPVESYHDVLFRKRNELSYDSRALVALAMLEAAGENRGAAMESRVRDLLTGDSDRTNPAAWYRESHRLALDLMVWSKLDPTGEKGELLLDKLMDAPKTRAAWGSTYLNCWTLMALADHTEAAAPALADTVCSVQFGDENRQVKFEPAPHGQTLEFAFEGDRRAVPLTLKMDSPARLFAHIEVESQPAILPMKPMQKGLGIDRTYHRLDAEGGLHPAENLEVGDLVLVTLHLNLPAGQNQYLAIDDPLPAIFEAVNPNFEGRAGNQQTAWHGDWKRLFSNYHELRTERSLFFCDYVYRSGDYAVQYLARVVAPGEVTAPPAKIEAMYEPHIFGLSGTSRIVAKPLKIATPERVAQN